MSTIIYVSQYNALFLWLTGIAYRGRLLVAITAVPMDGRAELIASIEPELDRIAPLAEVNPFTILFTNLLSLNHACIWPGWAGHSLYSPGLDPGSYWLHWYLDMSLHLQIFIWSCCPITIVPHNSLVFNGSSWHTVYLFRELYRIKRTSPFSHHCWRLAW